MQRTVIGRTGILLTRPNKRWCDVKFEGHTDTYKIRTTNMQVLTTPSGAPVVDRGE